MIRGIYTATSGMIAEEMKTNTIANNIANANTAGYKKDIHVAREFKNELITRLYDQNDGGKDRELGSMGFGVITEANFTNHSMGSMQLSDNPLDVAIEGEGYFSVQTEQGVRYTRDGSFKINAAQQLVTSDGYLVRGQGGAPITVLERGVIHIDPDGNVYSDNQNVGQLEMTNFANKIKLTKEGANLFRADEGANATPFNSKIRQGLLEMSNVNVVQEMVNLITSFRAYEINSKAVQTSDQLTDKAVNQVPNL